MAHGSHASDGGPMALKGTLLVPKGSPRSPKDPLPGGPGQPSCGPLGPFLLLNPWPPSW